ncbi:MAG: DUF4276 family protein [Bacteroidetes bacterium]|nr:DUF4276 family protein [Bacteroidota bacterium]
MSTGKKGGLKISKIKGIGLIVEDASDYESFKILIKRITNNNNLKFKKAIANGCGKIKRKAMSYAIDLHKRGCNMLILVHDLDRNDLLKLRVSLEDILAPSPLKYNFVCIPIEEIEAWFLSDPEGIKTLFSLKRKPKIKGNPEAISSPKEKLQDYIYFLSDKSKIYLNTKHNALLAEKLSLLMMRKKCRSFNKFYDFILTKTY